jgi:hypothetical protein
MPVAAAETKDEPEVWWSLKPLVRPPVPADASRRFGASSNPIDAFIAEGLARANLSPTPEAERRTLIRRLYFDLLGLPPAPEDIESFVGDRDPEAYAKLVDGLLASPRYGERWARHWLDVVHFGETHGYDKDQPRPNAWPYRDYVIRAFNEDKRFTRFVQEQVAGDVLFPGTRDGIEALGFVAAGPWDLIGHAEVPETKIDGKIARHLDRDDMVVNTIQTFNSLTIQCAQCHNHKFDPIPQEDYYSLQAVFAAVDRTNKKYDADPAVAKRRAELEEQQKIVMARRRELEATIAARAGAALTNLDQKIAEGEKRNRTAFGFHSNIEKSPDTLKWVQVDLGRSVVVGSVVLHPCHDDYNSIGDGFGFPVRFKVEVSNDSEFKDAVHMLADHLGADVPNPKLQAQSYDAGGKSARFVRVTASRLALRQDDYIFALAELEALTADGHNAALGATVASLDSIEAPVRWQRKNLTDGWYPGAPVTDSQELADLKEKRKALLEASTEPGEKSELAAGQQELATTKTALDKLPPLSTAYVAAVHMGTGAFAGTGAKGGQPRPIYLLPRGNVQKPGAEVGPGALSAVRSLDARFNLPPGHNEGERRAALARWLTDRSHPLTWRSIVNRVWQYHFGRGLVETPNDFGRMGATPTHPELLDWLAVEFRDGGQSFKALHRLIVTSATYRQGSVIAAWGDSKVSAAGADPQANDPDNRYLWRGNRRKIEAESVRDSILFVSGKIDLQMGGPSFQDFVVEKPEHSPHYQYHLSDPEDPKCHRRSIYRFVVRSQQQPFMTTLDCADPSMQVARRNESVSPLQALTLLNNSLVLAMSKHFAAKLQKLEGPLNSQVQRGYYEVTGRPPASEDLEMLTGYAREYGMTNLCRVLFNLNESTFVD